MKLPALSDLQPGTVWLAGAGPGDPGLLTAYTLYGLSVADVVVYDALVDHRILSLAGPAAVLVYAGKRGGKPSPQQEDISARLIAFAREGRRVLRLKGGDPFVFGRGAEEALALVAASIPFRIVPGVTAGIGGLAYAGIPVTHRTTNSAIMFVTGHDMTGTVPEMLDWDAVARTPVVVVYMVLKHLRQICERLIAHGRRAEEPAAIVAAATTESQHVVRSTLAEIAAATNRAGCKPPAMLVVGGVVPLREHLDWLASERTNPLPATPEAAA